MNLRDSRGSQCVDYVTVREEGVGMGRTFGKVYKRPVTMTYALNIAISVFIHSRK